MPPPTPKRPLKAPARVPIAASFQSSWSEGARRRWHRGDTRCRASRTQRRGRRLGGAAWSRCAREPGRAAILTDVDGTLAPIVERAEEAAVPAAAREALAALSERYGLVGCISGRRAEEARRLVGLDGIAYAGNHGLELLLPGEEAPRPDPSLAGREREAADFLATARRRATGDGRAAAGGQGADPGPALARRRGRGGAPRAAPARSPTRPGGRAWNRAGAARCWSCGRPGGGGKDAAVASLLADERLDRAVYAGDDRTDLDAFRRLRELREEGELERPRSASASLSPRRRPELAEESDLTVDGPDGWLAILEWLAE